MFCFQNYPSWRKTKTLSFFNEKTFPLFDMKNSRTEKCIKMEMEVIQIAQFASLNQGRDLHKAESLAALRTHLIKSANSNQLHVLLHSTLRQTHRVQSLSETYFFIAKSDFSVIPIYFRV